MVNDSVVCPRCIKVGDKRPLKFPLIVIQLCYSDVDLTSSTYVIELSNVCAKKRALSLFYLFSYWITPRFWDASNDPHIRRLQDMSHLIYNMCCLCQRRHLAEDDRWSSCDYSTVLDGWAWSRQCRFWYAIGNYIEHAVNVWRKSREPKIDFHWT